MLKRITSVNQRENGQAQPAPRAYTPKERLAHDIAWEFFKTHAQNLLDKVKEEPRARVTGPDIQSVKDMCAFATHVADREREHELAGGNLPADDPCFARIGHHFVTGDLPPLWSHLSIARRRYFSGTWPLVKGYSKEALDAREDYRDMPDTVRLATLKAFDGKDTPLDAAVMYACLDKSDEEFGRVDQTIKDHVRAGGRLTLTKGQSGDMHHGDTESTEAGKGTQKEGEPLNNATPSASVSVPASVPVPVSVPVSTSASDSVSIPPSASASASDSVSSVSPWLNSPRPCGEDSSPVVEQSDAGKTNPGLRQRDGEKIRPPPDTS